MFPNIFVINLPERRDRLEQFKEEALRIGILQWVTIIEGIRVPDAMHGFNKAQYNALKALEATANPGLILEDDVVFRNHEHLEQAISELPQDWDILYLGANVVGTDLCNWPVPVPVSPHLRRVTQAWTTHAVAYSVEGVKKVLAAWKPDQMFDDILRCNLEQWNAYIVSPMVADQRPGYSNIWNRHVHYGIFNKWEK